MVSSLRFLHLKTMNKILCILITKTLLFKITFDEEEK